MIVMSKQPYAGGLLAALVVLCLIPPAHGQEAQTVTLEEALYRALEQNVTVRLAETDVEARSSAVTAEWGDFLPSLGLNVAPSQTYGTSFDETTGQVSQEQIRSAYGQVRSDINLFNGFADVASLKEARRSQDASEQALSRTRQDVLFGVIEEFFGVLRAQEQVRIQEENLEAQRRQLEQVTGFTEVGERPISDRYQQETALAQAERDLLQAERDAKLAQTRLKQILELEPLQDYRFVAPSVDTTALAAETHELEPLLQEAYQRRADLDAQEARIAAAGQGVRVARSGYWPTVSLSASMSSRYTSLQDQIDFSDQFFDLNRQESFGLSINIPLFNRMQTRSRVDEAQARRRSAELEMESLRKDVALDVEQALFDYRMVQQDLEVARRQQRAARRALEATEERYRLGAADIVELARSRSEYVSAASGLVQARYNLLIQRKQIDYATGRLDPRQPVFE